MNKKTMEPANTATGKRPISTGLMETFWMLADTDQNVRVSAVEQMLQELQTIVNVLEGKTMKTGNKELVDEVTYTLKRLVKGLFSNRLLARIGYSTALVNLLNEYPAITCDNVVELIVEHAKDYKHDDVTRLTGEMFAYASLLRSNHCLAYKVHEANNEDDCKGGERDVLVKAVAALWDLKDKRPYITPLSYHIITHCAETLNRKQFRSLFWNVIKSDLSCGWSVCSQEILHLLLVCSRRFPKLVNNEFLAEHWSSTSPVLQISTLHNVMKTLKKGSSSHLSVERILTHKLGEELCHQLAQNNDLWKTFWQQHVKGSILHIPLSEPTGGVSESGVGARVSLSSVEHGHLLLSLLHCVLTLVHTLSEDQIKQVFFTETCQFLIMNASNKKSVGHAAAKSLLNFVVEIVENPHTTAETQLLLLNVLLANTICFDDLSKTKTVTNCVKSLKLEAAKRFYKLLISFYYTTKPFGVRYTTEDKQKLWVVQHLKSLSANAVVKADKELVCELLSFLFLHSFYLVTAADAQVCQYRLPSPPPPLNDECREITENTFWHALNHLLLEFYRHPSADMVDMFKMFTHQTLHLQGSDSARPLEPLTVETLEMFKTCSERLSALGKQIVAGEQERSQEQKIAQFFYLLGTVLVYELYINQQQIMIMIKDVWTCHERCMKEMGGPHRKERGGDMHWSIVIVDLILSLLEQSKYGLQLLLPEIFKALVPFLTPQAFNLIVQKLRNPAEEESGDDEDDVEDKEGVVMNGEHEEDDDAGEGEDEADEESEEDDDDEEDENENNIDDEFREQLRKALGQAAVCEEGDDNEKGEESSSNSSDMDDADMATLDQALAEVFKAKLGKKRQEKENLHVQMRCVTLLERGLLSTTSTATRGENERRVDMLLSCIEPVLELSRDNSGRKHVESKELAHKAHSFLKRVANLKVVPLAKINDKEALLLMQELINQTTKAFQLNQGPLVCNLIVFIIKVLLHHEDKNGVIKEQLVKQLRDLFKRWVFSGSHQIHDKLFVNLSQRLPSLLYHLVEDITLYMHADPDSLRLYRKTQLCGILLQILTLNQAEGLQLDKVVWDNCCTNVVSALKQSVNQCLQHGMKPNYITEMLSVLLRFIRIDALASFASKSLIQESSANNIIVKAQLKHLLDMGSNDEYPKQVKSLIGEITTTLNSPQTSKNEIIKNTMSKRQRKRLREKKLKQAMADAKENDNVMHPKSDETPNKTSPLKKMKS